MKHFRLMVATGVLLCATGTLRAQLIDGVKAVVHSAVITKSEVEDFTVPVAQEIDRQFRNQPEIREKRIEAALEDTLERLVDNQLILREYESAGYNLPESIIDQHIQEEIRTRYGDRVRLIKTLQQQGLTFEQYRKRMRDEFIIRNMRYFKTQGEIIISPHKIEVYYSQNTNEFKVDEQVRLRMIVLNKPSGDDGKVRALADEIQSKLAEGAAFSEMATLYSQGEQARRGGDWGWFEVAKLRKELADTAAQLKTGERSGVIDTPEACYLMLVEERRPVHVKPLGEVREEIEAILLKREHDRLQQQWIDRLKKKTFVRYF